MYQRIKDWIIRLDTLGMMASIIGNIFIVYKSSLGFVIWTIGNLLWIKHGKMTKQYPLIIMMVVYALLNVWGFLKWISDQ